MGLHQVLDAPENGASDVLLSESTPNILLGCFILLCVVHYGTCLCMYMLQTDILTDSAPCFSFIVCILTALVGSGVYTARHLLVASLVIACRLELGLYLLFRTKIRGRDPRLPTHKSQLPVYLGLWTFKIAWVYITCFNTMYLLAHISGPAFGTTNDITGLVLFCFGFIYQMIADYQKWIFRSKHTNEGIPMTEGLWKYSRHPNYFGEVVMWWSIYIISMDECYAMEDPWRWTIVLSPGWTAFLLLFVSGIPQRECDNLLRYYDNPKARPIIELYQSTTSPIIPFNPAAYDTLPGFIKRMLCFEYRQYQCRPSITNPGSSNKQLP